MLAFVMVHVLPYEIDHWSEIRCWWMSSIEFSHLYVTSSVGIKVICVNTWRLGVDYIYFLLVCPCYIMAFVIQPTCFFRVKRFHSFIRWKWPNHSLQKNLKTWGYSPRVWATWFADLRQNGLPNSKLGTLVDDEGDDGGLIGKWGRVGDGWMRWIQIWHRASDFAVPSWCPLEQQGAPQQKVRIGIVTLLN